MVNDRAVKEPEPRVNDVAARSTELFRKLPQEKQRRIFEAAVREFASKGYRLASMNSLVKAAGISKGSLFQYFRTKQDLFDGVVDIATAEVRAYLKEVRAETDRMPFFPRLDRILRAGFTFIDRRPLLARIYFHLPQSGEAPFGSERIALLRAQGVDFIRELIVEAQNGGELRDSLDTGRVAFLINALFETLLRAYYTEFPASGAGLYRCQGEDLDIWIQTTLDFVRRGVESE